MKKTWQYYYNININLKQDIQQITIILGTLYTCSSYYNSPVVEIY